MDVLSDVLGATRTRGTIFARAVMGSPWALRCDAVPMAAFHVVDEGTCSIRVDGAAEPVWLGTGDIALISRGEGHLVFDDERALATPLSDLIDQLSDNDLGDVHAGGPQRGTVLICGGYLYDHDGPHPLFAALPRLLHLPAPEIDANLRTVIGLVRTEFRGLRPGSKTVVVGLVDVMLTHIVRRWLDTLEGKSTGWVQALRDPLVAAALSTVHRDVSRAWTIGEVAAHVGASPSTLKRRFTELVGESPGSYIRRLRLDTAARLLRTTDLSAGAIARRVGYTSEYAFNRAFARSHGSSPGRYRTTSQTPSIDAAGREW